MMQVPLMSPRTSLQVDWLIDLCQKVNVTEQERNCVLLDRDQPVGTWMRFRIREAVSIRLDALGTQ